MDNLTHSVVGLGIGALIDRSLPPEPDAARAAMRGRTLLTLCCLASNFPDLDLLASGLLEQPLGYLLMHRGHTHTVVGLAVEMLVLLGLTWLLWPNARRLLHASAAARRGALVAAGAGLALHLAMDGLNVYGVHPFWPFDARWIYGDLVFIVEPVFWVGFGVPLAMLVRRTWLRRALLALTAAVLAGFTGAGYLQAGSLAALLVLGALLAWIAHLTGAHGGAQQPLQDARGHRGREALSAGLAAALAFVALQAAALHTARAIVAAEVARIDPGERLLDAAMSAYPANPLCWSFVTVASDVAHGRYHLRRGVLSIAPGVDPVSACPAPLAGGAAQGTAQLAWLDEARADLAALRSADRLNCHLHAWMRFARAPALDGGSASDMRFGVPGGRDFTAIDFADRAGTPCPRNVPGWGVPRADLLALPSSHAAATASQAAAPH
jgi:inner membrane protein